MYVVFVVWPYHRLWSYSFTTDGYGIFNVRTKLGTCRTQEGGPGTDNWAQELNRRDRKITVPHPASSGDRTQGLQIWISTLYNHWATSPRIYETNSALSTSYMLWSNFNIDLSFSRKKLTKSIKESLPLFFFSLSLSLSLCLSYTNMHTSTHTRSLSLSLPLSLSLLHKHVH